jgi:hypothetical protein
MALAGADCHRRRFKLSLRDLVEMMAERGLALLRLAAVRLLRKATRLVGWLVGWLERQLHCYTRALTFAIFFAGVNCVTLLTRIPEVFYRA